MSVSSISYVARSLRLRLPKLCVSISAGDAPELEQKAEQALREDSFLEFRLDALKSPAAAIPKIKKLMEFRPDAIFLATCRREGSGGHFAGSVEAQTELLLKASAAGCQIVDLEVESAQQMSSEAYQHFRSKVTTLLISYHDFEQTGDLSAQFAKMLAYEADFYKVVTTATSLYDNVRMMKFLQESSDHHFVVGHCMGEQGIVSRILSLRAGSVFTFAALGNGEQTAPGQVTLRELRDVYRIEAVDTVTRIYGVAGDPVSYSLSPYTMNTAFRRENVNAVLLRLHTSKIEDLLACVSDIPLSGLAVTMPFKRAIVPHLANSDVWTQRAKVCNTVVRGQDGRLFGFNTDVVGILAPLEELIPLKDAKVLVLGAGGAAHAAVFGLLQKGADVSILNRTAHKGAALAAEAGIQQIKHSDLASLEFDVIINATPVGMGESKNSPLMEKELKARIVFDLVYNPYETPLLKMARAKGLAAISGAEMFVHQGARQFEIWTGAPAPVGEMRQELFRQLNVRPIETVLPAPKAVESEPEVVTVPLAVKEVKTVPEKGKKAAQKATVVKVNAKAAVEAKPSTPAKATPPSKKAEPKVIPAKASVVKAKSSAKTEKSSSPKPVQAKAAPAKAASGKTVAVVKKAVVKSVAKPVVKAKTSANKPAAKSAKVPAAKPVPAKASAVKGKAKKGAASAAKSSSAKGAKSAGKAAAKQVKGTAKAVKSPAKKSGRKK